MTESGDALTPLKVIRSWRKYVEAVAEAVKSVAPEARIYLIGGAAEARLTVRSDIDVLIVLPEEPDIVRAADLRARILRKAEEVGLPLYAPVELHIVGPKGLERYARKGRVIRLG